MSILFKLNKSNKACFGVTKTPYVKKTNITAFNLKQLRVLSLVVFSVVLSACSATSANIEKPTSHLSPEVTRIDFECELQVKQREKSLTDNAQASAYLALANHAERCINGIQFFTQHPDNATAMQFNALSVLNLIKAGELKDAQQSLAAFKSRFPRQDLVLSDFTSFVDTATVLLHKATLTEFDTKRLNINPTLRAELARQAYWSAN